MILNLGCGEDHHSDAVNVDAVPQCNPDRVVELEKYPWPWDDESVQGIRAWHVFEHLQNIERTLVECARILERGGTLNIILPVGVNAHADPDHQWGKTGRVWTWQTPHFYCGQRHWDTDVGLLVVEKDVNAVSHLHGVQGLWNRARWVYQQWRHGPGEWCFAWPCSSGEFEVTFKKP